MASTSIKKYASLWYSHRWTKLDCFRPENLGMQARFSSTLQISPSMKETCHYMEGIHAQHMKSRNAARSLVKIEKPAIHLHLAGQSLHGCNFPPKEIEDLFRRRSCAEVSWRSFALGLHSKTTFRVGSALGNDHKTYSSLETADKDHTVVPNISFIASSNPKQHNPEFIGAEFPTRHIRRRRVCYQISNSNFIQASKQCSLRTLGRAAVKERQLWKVMRCKNRSAET